MEMKIGNTAILNMWLSTYNSVDNFEIEDCLLLRKSDTYTPSNYVLVGECEVTVNKLTTKDEMIDIAVKDLKEQKKKLSADYEVSINQIDAKINQLLAIENKSDVKS